jgi:hypothetical protein
MPLEDAHCDERTRRAIQFEKLDRFITQQRIRVEGFLITKQVLGPYLCSPDMRDDYNKELNKLNDAIAAKNKLEREL